MFFRSFVSFATIYGIGLVLCWWFRLQSRRFSCSWITKLTASICEMIFFGYYQFNLYFLFFVFVLGILLWDLKRRGCFCFFLLVSCLPMPYSRATWSIDVQHAIYRRGKYIQFFNPIGLPFLLSFNKIYSMNCLQTFFTINSKHLNRFHWVTCSIENHFQNGYWWFDIYSLAINTYIKYKKLGIIMHNFVYFVYIFTFMRKIYKIISKNWISMDCIN